jgi:peptidoglycan/LPS O-acetylase OafA/YrhL
LLAASVAAWRGLDSTFGWVASIHPEWKDLVTRTDYRFDALLWGCAAALLWHSRSVRDFINRRLSLGWAGVAVLIMGVTLWREVPGYQAIFALLAPVPILYTVARPGSWLGRFLEHRPIAWLGRISYSVYLWQMLFLPAYGIPVSLPWIQTFPLNLVFTVTVAIASYYLVERPLRIVGRRLAARLPARVGVVRAPAPA